MAGVRSGDVYVVCISIVDFTHTHTRSNDTAYTAKVPTAVSLSPPHPRETPSAQTVSQTERGSTEAPEGEALEEQKQFPSNPPATKAYGKSAETQVATQRAGVIPEPVGWGTSLRASATPEMQLNGVVGTASGSWPWTRETKRPMANTANFILNVPVD